ncbi:MAG: alpha-ribazole phosphatase [Deltaproteobacteria bacterium]|jgi:probable phosphoglycerate mutase|nr:alpha-ribazole phosphatase [Deltaproteobacteria bacterium]
MTKTIQIYLLRHGEILIDDPKRYIGQTDAPLSSKGVYQAARWKEQFSHVMFEKVYCSDLTRAFDTARIVSGFSDSDITAMPQLREIDLGDWDGERMDAIKTHFPGAWKERGRHMARFRVPHGESFQDLHERVVPVFLKIASAATGNVLVVAHAGVNRIILCHLLKKPIQELFSIPQDSAALNLIENVQGKFVVRAMNRLPG